MALMPSYEAHVAARKGKSYVQYLSCHSLSLRWALAGKVYFVVMKNLMPVQPWLSFDLKGATANRRALKVSVQPSNPLPIALARGEPICAY